LEKKKELQTNYFDYTFSLINGKWKLRIIHLLHHYEVIRYNELQRLLIPITAKTLSTTLKEMSNDGLVERKEYPEIPPKVEYRLTKRGEYLYPIVFEMCIWGMENY